MGKNVKAVAICVKCSRNGYILPLKSVPPPFHGENNKTSFRHEGFVQGAINELLKGGLVVEVGEPPHCCNPLTVSEKGGKLRLVIDLRHVNQFIDSKTFKYGLRKL